MIKYVKCLIEKNSSDGKCNSNSNSLNCNSNILHCLQHVIVIERKLSNSNLLHCNVTDPRPVVNMDRVCEHFVRVPVLLMNIDHVRVRACVRACVRMVRD